MGRRLFGALEIIHQAQIDEAVASGLVVNIRLVDIEQIDRLQIHGPPISDTPLQRDGQCAGRTVHIPQHTSDNFAALNVVERKAGGEYTYLTYGLSIT